VHYFNNVVINSTEGLQNIKWTNTVNQFVSQ